MNKVDLINESCNKIKHKSNTVSSPRQLRTSCQVKHISFLLAFPLMIYFYGTQLFLTVIVIFITLTRTRIHAHI